MRRGAPGNSTPPCASPSGLPVAAGLEGRPVGGSRLSPRHERVPGRHLPAARPATGAHAGARAAGTYSSRQAVSAGGRISGCRMPGVGRHPGAGAAAHGRRAARTAPVPGWRTTNSPWRAACIRSGWPGRGPWGPPPWSAPAATPPAASARAGAASGRSSAAGAKGRSRPCAKQVADPPRGAGAHPHEEGSRCSRSSPPAATATR